MALEPGGGRVSVGHRVSSDHQLARLLQIGIVLEEVVEARSYHHYQSLDDAPALDPEIESLLEHAAAESAAHRERLEELVDELDAESIPFDEIEARVAYVLENGVAPAIVGGDHSTTLPVLRAIADEHGPVSLVQYDAHSDLWTEYFGKDHNHGTTVHYAIEEGLVDPETSIRIGDRGGLYGPEDVERFEASGIEYHTIEEFEAAGVAAMRERVAEVTEGPTFATIDIDAVDPAFAPGTGTPMPGGMTSRELLQLTRALHDVEELVGFDVVEVSPPYDDRSGSTAVLAANVAFEALCALVR